MRGTASRNARSYFRKKRRACKYQGNQPASPPVVKYSNPGVLRDLSTEQLNSGLAYQRSVEPKAIDELIQNWDLRQLEPINVSLRDGKFNVLDGRHRITSMKKMAGGQEVIVPCRIFTGLSYEDEAELYALLDKSRRRLSMREPTNAEIESGANAELIEIRRLAEENGFTWTMGEPTGAPDEIGAVRALISAYRLLGGAAFSRMLYLLAGTWHGSPRSLKAGMISGMALFLKTYETEVNDRAFIQRLSETEPDEIIRQSNVDFSTNRTALRFARVIRDKYNGQKRGGRKLPYRFKDCYIRICRRSRMGCGNSITAKEFRYNASQYPKPGLFCFR